jgi:Glycosyltransferase WbsX
VITSTFPRDNACEETAAKVRAIAHYLPQFHPIRENDEWWGPGFTEWTNVSKARRLYPGHYQPHIPADLGFYDLRLAEVREAQASMARAHGIEAFCYYHYWFAGRQLLERPFNEVLASGSPDFPFCLCWANQTWTGVWHGAPNRILVEQTYPGEADHREHFEALLPAFYDSRYLRVDGKPVFLIYAPAELPSSPQTLDLWRRLAERAGLPGLYLVCETQDPYLDPHSLGYDASVVTRVRMSLRQTLSWRQLVPISLRRLAGGPTVVPYRDATRHMVTPPVDGITSHPCVLPNWDNTPRSGARGLVFHGSTPEQFRMHLREGIRRAAHEPEGKRLLFIKSWNEWAEGNHLEPDLKWGRAYLNVLREELVGSSFLGQRHDGATSRTQGSPHDAGTATSTRGIRANVARVE